MQIRPHFADTHIVGMDRFERNDETKVRVSKLTRRLHDERPGMYRQDDWPDIGIAQTTLRPGFSSARPDIHRHRFWPKLAILHRPGFRFRAASTRLTRFGADASSASQIRNSVSIVGDFRFRSSWLM